jgi:hypothetical protein
MIIGRRSSMKKINAVVTGEDRRHREEEIGVSVQGGKHDRIVMLTFDEFERGEGIVSFRLNDLLECLDLPADSVGGELLQAADKERQAVADAEAEAVVMSRK